MSKQHQQVASELSSCVLHVAWGKTACGELSCQLCPGLGLSKLTAAPKSTSGVRSE